MSTMKHLFGACTLLLLLVFFTQCKDDDSASPKGSATIEITDGPIDDTNVKGAFVTVTSVKVDGAEISGFSKQTVDLMAYQNGSTKTLGTIDLESGTYSDITLILDYEKDASGNSPGCYVLTQDNTKHSLQATSSTTSELKISNGSFDVKEGSTTNLVVDFDLRKAIRHEDTPQATDEYDFVSEAELQNSIRFVAKAETGKIAGKCNDNLGMAGDKIVVYAYAKGDFNKQTEVQGQGTSQITFKNAVTSAAVDAQGNYTLSFLESGDYELHFFGYQDSNSDGQLELMSELELNLLGNLGIDLNNVSVGAGANISLSVNIIGLLP
ncbi:MAG: DUF4382 domain-containing protein [Bacteroidetes bacterium]|nr:DUF4382 domain-containing protein [Bacteroidota bacterium]